MSRKLDLMEENLSAMSVKVGAIDVRTSVLETKHEDLEKRLNSAVAEMRSGASSFGGGASTRGGSMRGGYSGGGGDFEPLLEWIGWMDWEPAEGQSEEDYRIEKDPALELIKKLINEEGRFDEELKTCIDWGETQRITKGPMLSMIRMKVKNGKAWKLRKAFQYYLDQHPASLTFDVGPPPWRW